MINLKFQSKRGKGLDIAPLVDVVFLLLIFFMLTSTFIRQEGMDIELPEAESSGSFEATSVKIQIQKDGTLIVQEKPMPIKELPSFMEQAVSKDRKVPVIIEADKSTPFDMFARVLDAARLVGAQNIVIATDPNPSSTPALP